MYIDEAKQSREAVTTDQARNMASTLFLAKVFNWMAIGLGLTGILAALVASSTVARQIFIANPVVLFGLIIVELGLVFYLSARIERISSQAATSLFVTYAVLNGITFSFIFEIYTTASIAGTFFITAGMFGAMAIYGMVTKKDLTSLGSFLFMGLIGIIIGAVINVFLQSPMMAWIISGVGVIVFTGLTAYDVQKLTRMGASGIMSEGENAIRKGAILGALALYLDFINLFLHLLYFLGNRE